MLIRRPPTVPRSARTTVPGASADNKSMGLRYPRRSVVVCVGEEAASYKVAQRLASSLGAMGVETRYIGRRDDADEIANLVAEEGADTVELCLAAGSAGVVLLRQLLRRLIEIGRRDVSIVVHRVR